MSIEPNYLLSSDDFAEFKQFLGNKTWQLKRCVDWGFMVPKFIALPATLSPKLFADATFRTEIAHEITRVLPAQVYAVRSSALIEDGKTQSLAGQFLTQINISAPALSQSIYAVLKQANTHLNGQLSEFSLLIQEYIQPDIAGVTFTRNPNGNHEMVIEYDYTDGENIVGGVIRPKTVSLYWNDVTIARALTEPVLLQVIEASHKLEIECKFPQDIEWCIKDQQLFVLQTRPITTITSKQYQQICFLEDVLPKQQPYYFAKTEISEIAPRPTPFTFALLQQIYSITGPVNQAYQKHKVAYSDTAALKIIGNELYIDKEKEICGILPAYSYFSNKNFSPKLHTLAKLPRTLKNIFALYRINPDNYEQYFNNLKKSIEQPQSFSPDLKQRLKIFFANYELIFSTNILAGIAQKKLSASLRTEAVTLTELISARSLFVDANSYQVACPINLTGNSLEISDESVFTANEYMAVPVNHKVEQWWGHLPSFKRKVLQPKIKAAIIFERLRELGRWLAIKNINALRAVLLNGAWQHKFTDVTNIYFADLDSIQAGTINERECIAHRAIYEKNNSLTLPNSLTSSYIIHASKVIGVSSGVAQGVLLDAAAIDSKSNIKEKIILYTELLSPDLTKYFDKIVGIVSQQGGILSHLSIIAREKNLPVIVGYSIGDSNCRIGDLVTINGSTGEVVLS
ncbi:MAG: PEP-utilizing enzyme, mobile region [uncultured bacterium]|nr:MAG: PEP-utilizing enzyme, mobile region [uncultured bacterium]